jgi:hypothetical protein
VRDFNFFLFTYSPEKPQKIVDLFLIITYKHFEPFAVTMELMLVEFMVASSCHVVGLSV